LQFNAARVDVPKAPRGCGLGRGYPPPLWERGLEREMCPLPRIFFIFEFNARKCNINK